MHLAPVRRVAGPLLAVMALTTLPAIAQDSASINVTRNSEATPFGYAPSSVNVSPGATVTWSNPQIHTTGAAEDHPTNCRQGTSNGTCPWSSEALSPGGSFSITFPAEGTFTYFCAVHPYMEGTVVVGDGDPTQPAPEPTSDPDPQPGPTSDPVPDPEPTATDDSDAPPPNSPSEPDDTQSVAPSTSDAPSGGDPTTDETSGATSNAGGGDNPGATPQPEAQTVDDDNADEGSGAGRIVIVVGALGLLGVAIWWVSRTWRAEA